MHGVRRHYFMILFPPTNARQASELPSSSSIYRSTRCDSRCPRPPLLSFDSLSLIFSSSFLSIYLSFRSQKKEREVILDDFFLLPLKHLQHAQNTHHTKHTKLPSLFLPPKSLFLLSKCRSSLIAAAGGCYPLSPSSSSSSCLPCRAHTHTHTFSSLSLALSATTRRCVCV